VARTTATNFSGGLQFPYATAATDLFKKEDVQTLALAVDGHDHTAGKGLILPAAAIPDGSITSAKIADGTITSADIADGTIATVDLAPGACTTVPIYVQAAGNSTTSTTDVAIPGAQVSITTIGGTQMHVWACVPLYNAGGANAVWLSIQVDSGALIPIAFANLAAAAATEMVCGFTTVAPAPSAGSHTIKMYWRTSGGTLTQNAAATTGLLAIEFRR
jgi:hypothetical protein